MIRYAADAFQFIVSLVVIIVKRFRAVVWKDVDGGGAEYYAPEHCFLYDL